MGRRPATVLAGSHALVALTTLADVFDGLDRAATVAAGGPGDLGPTWQPASTGPPGT